MAKELIVVQCPACNVCFEVGLQDLESFSRQVRCSSCQHMWRVSRQVILSQKGVSEVLLDFVKEESLDEIPESEDILDEEEQDPVEEAFGTAHSSSVSLRLFSVIGFLCLAGVGFFFGQDWIMQSFPQTKKVYAWLEITPDYSKKFSLEQTSWTKGELAGDPAIIVEGTVVNNTGTIQETPMVQVKIVGDDLCRTGHMEKGFLKNLWGKGLCILGKYRIPLKKDKLLPQEKVHFSQAYKFRELAEIKQVMFNFFVKVVE